MKKKTMEIESSEFVVADAVSWDKINQKKWVFGTLFVLTL